MIGLHALHAPHLHIVRRTALARGSSSWLSRLHVSNGVKLLVAVGAITAKVGRLRIFLRLRAELLKEVFVFLRL